MSNKYTPGGALPTDDASTLPALKCSRAKISELSVKHSDVPRTRSSRVPPSTRSKGPSALGFFTHEFASSFDEWCVLGVSENFSDNASFTGNQPSGRPRDGSGRRPLPVGARSRRPLGQPVKGWAAGLLVLQFTVQESPLCWRRTRRQLTEQQPVLADPGEQIGVP